MFFILTFIRAIVTEEGISAYKISHVYSIVLSHFTRKKRLAVLLLYSFHSLQNYASTFILTLSFSSFLSEEDTVDVRI